LTISIHVWTNALLASEDETAVEKLCERVQPL
jgi:hypothetical protein